MEKMNEWNECESFTTIKGIFDSLLTVNIMYYSVANELMATLINNGN